VGFERVRLEKKRVKKVFKKSRRGISQEIKKKCRGKGTT